MEQTTRKLKIYDQSNGYKFVPTLMIKGDWVKEYGFNSGDYIEVKCENEKIIITKIEEENIPKVIDNFCKHCKRKFIKKTKYCPECVNKLA